MAILRVPLSASVSFAAAQTRPASQRLTTHSVRTGGQEPEAGAQQTAHALHLPQLKQSGQAPSQEGGEALTVGSLGNGGKQIIVNK